MLHGAGIVVVIVLLVVLFAAASGRVESPVVGRRGDVIYWAASFVASLLALLAAAVALLKHRPGWPLPRDDICHLRRSCLARPAGVPVRAGGAPKATAAAQVTAFFSIIRVRYSSPLVRLCG
jgi:hypothetical protein